MESLKESLHHREFSGTSSCNGTRYVSDDSLNDDDDDDDDDGDDDDDDYGKNHSEDGETKLMAGLNLTNDRTPLSTCNVVGGGDIKENSASKEDKINGDDSHGSFAQTTKGDRSENDSKIEGRESSVEPLQLPPRRRAPPARRVIRQSFRASLNGVTEDKEEEEEEANDTTTPADYGDGGDVVGGDSRRPERLSSRFRTKQRTSLQFPRDNSIRLSSIFNSDTRISLSSFQRSDSVDLMDFGVDHHRGPLFANSSRAESSRSLITGATGESMSNFVDSQGFLGWGSNSNSEQRDRDHDEKEESSTSITAVGENGNNEISSHSLHDSSSSGFLGWDGRIYDNDTSRKLKPHDNDGASATSANNDDNNNDPIAHEGNLKADDDDGNSVHSKMQFGAHDGPATADDEIENHNLLMAEEEEDSFSSKSWHIEDYEGPNDNNVINDVPAMITKRVRSRTTFTERITSRLSQSVQGLERGLRNSNFAPDEPNDDGIRTSVVKRILLTGRNPSMDELSLLSNNRNEMRQSHTSAPGEQQQQQGILRKSLFGGIIRSMSSGDTPLPSSTFDDYSRPAIIINREDDVDIGELRKELLEAGSKTS